MSVEQRWVVGGIYATMIVLALFDANYHLPYIRQPFSVIIRPMLDAQRFFESSITFPVRLMTNVMRSEQIIADLQSKNIQLQVQIGEAAFTKQENLRLLQELEKTTLQTSSDLFKTAVVANVIHADTLTILDKGSDDGVKNGGLVFIQGVLIGKIKEVDTFFTKMVSFSQESWSTAAQTQSGIKGVVIGKKNQVLFTQVAADKNIEVGDQVFSVGSYVDGVPPGLYLGQITQVQENIGAPVQTAVISQLADGQTAQTVIIKMRE